MSRDTTRWGYFAGALTSLLWVLSLPPFEFAEAAYIAFVPLLLWLSTRPTRRLALTVAAGSGWLAWAAVLIWLRHVTIFGTAALSAVLAIYFVAWTLFAHWALPKLQTRQFGLRLLGFAALAGAWVVLEWVRSWALWGFPWAPIALSQWQRPVVLQIAAWTGASGVSFLLIFFNLCVAQTLWLRATTRERKLLTGWFSPDLYAAIAALALCIVVFFKSLPQVRSTEPLFSAGVVQPYIPAVLKWEPAREQQNLQTLERQTRFVSHLESDVILWPEAATPWPVLGEPQMQQRIEAFVRELGRPLLMGNLAYLQDSDVWQNGVFLVDPQAGLSEHYYAKRRLVPFGEYVPKPFGFIEKVVPVGGAFTPGTTAGLIELSIEDNTLRIGSLVCYEDSFPVLARDSVRAGAQVLFVATNNAWYGEEGGAPQHAAHSVLRAVENRRPVVRCGNGGWSGWIDAYGTIRETLVDAEGSIYFRGGGQFSVFQYPQWLRRQSYYTLQGDWFVVVCGALVCLAVVVVWIRKNEGDDESPPS
ncbi:MAG: apolipoprotein N-acyltransferase [Opitutales bacterium]